LNALPFSKFFTEILTALYKPVLVVLDFPLPGNMFHPVPRRLRGRFRERHEAVRDATGPSRLSKPFA
jgi:hypothetical protein